jgi:hypothetical protein
VTSQEKLKYARVSAARFAVQMGMIFHILGAQEIRHNASMYTAQELII